jgi:uncharacterized DUF497 family protein
MEFEWDPRKAAENYRKHGIRFEEAQEAFFDPNAVEIYDDKHSDVEARFMLIAFSPKRLLWVGFTVRRNDVIRIITSRKATAEERRQYYEKR